MTSSGNTNKSQCWPGFPWGWFLLVSVGILAVFGYWYPSHFLIADEVAYFQQALAWLKGTTTICPYDLPCDTSCTPVLPGEYPAGTALLAIPFILAAGPKAVFWSGIFCWLAGTWAMVGLLQGNGKDIRWAAYPWLFIPALILTRTLMSDLPGFALAALFLLLFTARINLFWAGVVGGLGLLFRETNILWVLPFLAGATWRRSPGWAWGWAGWMTGVMPRLISGWLCFGHPFFFKDPGIAFSIHLLPQNLAFYLLALLVLLPGGLWFLWRSDWVYRREAAAATLLLVLFYAGYGYDAFAKSGYKALVLQGRYVLPLLPFLTVAAAHGATAWHHIFRFWGNGLVLAAMLLFLSVQFAGWQYNTEQQRFTEALLRFRDGRHISCTPEETRKYWSALNNPAPWYDGARMTAQQLACDTVWYAHIISRGESDDRRKKALEARQLLHRIWPDTLPNPVVHLIAADGATLDIWRFKRK